MIPQTKIVKAQITKESYDKEKRKLPMIAYSNKFSYTYNGTFSEIDSTHLISYSNVTAMDFDHIGTQAEMTDLRNWLIKTPCTDCQGEAAGAGHQ